MPELRRVRRWRSIGADGGAPERSKRPNKGEHELRGITRKAGGGKGSAGGDLQQWLEEKLSGGAWRPIPPI